MRLAIYDLDKTLTRKPTFTPFLMFAAGRLAPWRLAFAPIWIASMIAYRMGAFDRTALKRWGMRLMLGRSSPEALDRIGQAFARRRIARSGYMPGALRLLEEDRAVGARIVIATAAFAFYARHFASDLAIDTVIGTDWRDCDIPGGNCYGDEKLRRVRQWLRDEGIYLEASTIRFVSDSFADAPLLDLVDEPIFATPSARAARLARRRGWRVVDLSR